MLYGNYQSKHCVREYFAENDIGWLIGRHPGWEKLAGIGACGEAVLKQKKAVKNAGMTWDIYDCFLI